MELLEVAEFLDWIGTKLTIYVTLPIAILYIASELWNRFYKR